MSINTVDEWFKDFGARDYGTSEGARKRTAGRANTPEAHARRAALRERGENLAAKKASLSRQGRTPRVQRSSVWMGPHYSKDDSTVRRFRVQKGGDESVNTSGLFKTTHGGKGLGTGVRIYKSKLKSRRK